MTIIRRSRDETNFIRAPCRFGKIMQTTCQNFRRIFFLRILMMIAAYACVLCGRSPTGTVTFGGQEKRFPKAAWITGTNLCEGRWRFLQTLAVFLRFHFASVNAVQLCVCMIASSEVKKNRDKILSSRLIIIIMIDRVSLSRQYYWVRFCVGIINKMGISWRNVTHSLCLVWRLWNFMH